MAEKTPPIVVGLNGEVISVTTAGGLVGLANPDQFASRWVAGTPQDYNYTGAIDMTDDSFCFDSVVSDGGVVFFTTENRNQVEQASPSSYLHSFDTVAKQEIWGPPTLGSNLRVLETNHISLLYADNSIWIPTISSLNFPTGLTVVSDETAGTTAVVKPICMWNTSSNPETDPATMASIEWKRFQCAGTMGGGAFLPATTVSGTPTMCPNTGCAVLLNLYTPWTYLGPIGFPGGAVETTAMFAFTKDVLQTPNSAPLWSTQAKFRASENNPNPIVDKWSGKIYFTTISDPILNFENPCVLYCIDSTKPLVSGQAQNCDGFGLGSQGGVSLPNAFPLNIVEGQTAYLVQWLYAGALVPNAAFTNVDRILYSVTLNGILQIETPIGCLFTVSPYGACTQTSRAIALTVVDPLAPPSPPSSSRSRCEQPGVRPRFVLHHSRHDGHVRLG